MPQSKPRSDYMGLTYSGSAVVGLGLKGSVTLGFIPQDGVFIQFKCSPFMAMGFDISHSLNIEKGFYKGQGIPTAMSQAGLSRNYDIGALFINVGYSQDRVETLDPNRIPLFRVTDVAYGQVWETYSIGGTLGSKSAVGGTKSWSYTSYPIYLYKK